jgi:hypothetical protein
VLGRSVFADCLRNGDDMTLIEAAFQGGTSMA